MPQNVEISGIPESQTFTIQLPSEWEGGFMDLSLGLDGDGNTPAEMIRMSVGWQCPRRRECAVSAQTEQNGEIVLSASISCSVEICPIEE